MVKKTNPKRIWENRQKRDENQKKQQRIKVQQMIESLDQQNASQNEKQLSSSFSEQQQDQSQGQVKNNQAIQEKQNISSVQIEKCTNNFKITSQILASLTEQIYKGIILPQFIQTNDSYRFINDNNQLSSDNQGLKIKEHQRQRISSFIFQQSLQISLYYKQFEKPYKQNSNKSFNTQQIGSNSTKNVMQKRDFLLYSNSVLLDLSNIKFLNIYGPTGSGKTYMLKQIFKSRAIEKNIIWVNGMNIFKGKTKRFLTQMKNRFDSLLWQTYLKSHSESKQIQNDFFTNIFNHQNENILVLDEYDQLAHFDMTDLLKFSYLKLLKTQGRDKIQKSRQICLISKIILVSNTFSTQINHQNIEKNVNLNNKKTLFLQNLVFRPFCDKQAVQILKQKIKIVNTKFCEFFNKQNSSLKSLFQSNPTGIFTDQKLLHLIKKICYGDEVDIRKILFFYADSMKKLTEMFQEKFEQNSETLIKKFKDYLINEKFVLSIINNQPFILQVQNPPKLNVRNYQTQSDLNPVVFYIFNLENEGKNVLKALHKQATLRKRQTYRSSQKNEINENNQKKTQRIQSAINQKTSLQKKKQNLVKFQDFYKKIRPRLQFSKIFHWIYQWQQVGLLKIKKDLSSFEGFQSINKKLSSQIKVMDNYLIELLDQQSIEKGLQIY